jgi:tRNA A37 threonylcarbamoyltransferase TsaD
VEVSLPAKAMCTDNAAMVALLGERRMAGGTFSGPDLNAYAASRFSR